MVTLFVLIGVGYVVTRAKIIDEHTRSKLTGLVLDVTMPALILSSVMGDDVTRDLHTALQVTVITVIIYIAVPLVSLLIVKLLRFPYEKQGLYAFMMSYSNVGFMGFPIVQSLFGAQGMVYTAIVNIGFNISSFSIGTILIQYPSKNEAGKINLKKLLSPGILGSLLAFVIYIADISVPDDIHSICSTLGAVTTPMAMMLVGSSLATVNIRTVFNDLRAYLFVAVSQILLPLGIWALMRQVITDSMVINVITILMMMSTANNSVLFSIMYGKDEKLAARTVFLSTMLAIITVPTLMSFISN